MMIDKPVTNADLKMTRFKYVWENISDPAIYDTITGNCYFINDEDDIERIVDRLNEQQVIITALKEENEQLKKQLELRTESDKYHQRMLLKWLCIDEDEEKRW